MKTIRMLGIPFALLLLLVLAVGPAYAQGAQPCITSVSTNTNVMGMNNWQTLCGQSAVYSFSYDGADDPVLLQMATNPQNSANFFVYTASEFQKGLNQANLANGNGDSNNAQFIDTLAVPIGMGTAQASKDSNGDQILLNNGTLMWRGDSTTAGTYFVVVQPTSGQPSSFWIDASGSGVSGFHYVAASKPAQAAPQLAMAATGTGGNNAVPQFLPRTGGEFEAMQLLAAGAALLSAGLFLRRRK